MGDFHPFLSQENVRDGYIPLRNTATKSISRTFNGGFLVYIKRLVSSFPAFFVCFHNIMLSQKCDQGKHRCKTLRYNGVSVTEKDWYSAYMLARNLTHRSYV
ncbi:hypothetical protein NPIL_129901 [Nephila pilipes]|uniref:Uncharacterized protein n=1 Tax=Nephila pilipes TaxID=299642 RepID=A0A8X6PCG4_NEPPI|nr:hypothetical protein NPIL_129901 [Nephila pilipes]